jgi:hypothetical protein
MVWDEDVGWVIGYYEAERDGRPSPVTGAHRRQEAPVLASAEGVPPRPPPRDGFLTSDPPSSRSDGDKAYGAYLRGC